MAKFSDHQAAGRGCDKQEVQRLHSTFKKKETKTITTTTKIPK